MICDQDRTALRSMGGIGNVGRDQPPRRSKMSDGTRAENTIQSISVVRTMLRRLMSVLGSEAATRWSALRVPFTPTSKHFAPKRRSQLRQGFRDRRMECAARLPAHARSGRLNPSVLDRAHGQWIQDRRTGEGHAEQAHEGSARDDPGSARRCRRPRLSRRASQEEPRLLSEARRQALAEACGRHRRRSGQSRQGGASRCRGGAAARLPARPGK
jgi:hypothetical protein